MPSVKPHAADAEHARPFRDSQACWSKSACRTIATVFNSADDLNIVLRAETALRVEPLRTELTFDELEQVATAVLTHRPSPEEASGQRVL